MDYSKNEIDEYLDRPSVKANWMRVNCGDDRTYLVWRERLKFNIPLDATRDEMLPQWAVTLLLAKGLSCRGKMYVMQQHLYAIWNKIKENQVADEARKSLEKCKGQI